MIATVQSSTLRGVKAQSVQVEAHIGRGLPGFEIVGLAEAAVRESRVRVKSAIVNSGFEKPKRLVVMNLAPADQPKRGAHFDLAIAVGVLTAHGCSAPNLLDRTLILGELSLTGELRPLPSIVPHLLCGQKAGLSFAIVPAANAAEAALIPSMDVLLAHTLAEAISFLNGRSQLARAKERPRPTPSPPSLPDLSTVQGQAQAKRALEVAAVGGHHILMLGSPGAGKTMLAERLPSLLPRPSEAEMLEIRAIASAAGQPYVAQVERPFRAPHHSASVASLVGGGDPIRAGEVTLAHHGVLFLDELPEFSRTAVQSLRTTMEAGEVTITRSRERAVMPAAAQVVAAMNPCPCGYAGDPRRECSPCPERLRRYQARISGPMLDRFDIHVELPRPELPVWTGSESNETSEDVRARVVRARHRLEHAGPTEQSTEAPSFQTLFQALPPSLQDWIQQSAAALGLSMRGVTKAIRVAQSIAALAEREQLQESDLCEAFQYRLLDRLVAKKEGSALP